MAPLLLCALLILGAQAQPRTPIPTLREYVTDQTGTLSATEIAGFSDRLRQFDDSTSTQIVVVMIPTIGQNALEEVSLKIAESNKVGQEKTDNGVLLLIVKNDRLLRIEVGYGLEGVLTDALAGQIIRSEVAPYFRDGEYAAGVLSGTRAIMAATRNEYRAPKKRPRNDSLTGLFPLLILLVVFFVVMRSARRGGGGRRRGLGSIPYLGPTGGWTGNTRGGGWSSGGGWGGGFGGGGGFSGGGGGFGGGGASGSW